ncbi:MAG: M6 family metalloprotease domain-containing protein [Bacteroidales bacterium]|nr:M6 family metalloprotease domain-containing protein [Bacteroidales bacterium]
MKKLLISLLLLASVTAANAIIAPRTPYKVRQPDGSYITLVNHGDEFHHWTTRVDDHSVMEFGADGYWKPSVYKAPTQESRARRQKAQQMRAMAAESSISMGEKHFLVILIEFNNLSFTLSNPQDAFYRLLNEQGYSENGGTGSVKDFYSLNSSGKFIPTFDVYGPATLSHDYGYYGRDTGMPGSDERPDEALYEACQILDEQIDFSQYDHDGDGFVDNIFFYYAGNNQAEGANSNTIWPHAWALYNFNAVFDGVRAWSYACASEYKGPSGKRMCGIGTFTHEFGHVLGLPDFYDTNDSQEGDADGLGTFSTMDSGCYNNDGRTPPLFNAVERNMLGWMDEPEQLVMGGDYTLESIINNKAYCSLTSNDGEIFIYEVRDGTGWDAYNAAGLVVYHMDKSNNRVGNSTAAQRWAYGYGINEVGAHPCFYVVPSVSLWPTEYAVYPGATNVTSIEPVEWNGAKISSSLSNIAYSQGVASFTLKASPLRSVRGSVVDSNGTPIENARVYGRHGNTTSGTPDFGVSVGIGGSYILNLSIEQGDGTFTLVALAPGYEPAVEYLDLRFTPSSWVEFRLKEAEGSGPNLLTMLGYNTIATLPEYREGDVFPLEVIASADNNPLSVSWYWDDAPVSATSVTLTRGKHTVKAVQTFADRTEDLYLELSVD